ncbi:DNA cytosine methyltransferase [Streptomonospora salina]|uniref:DNA (cytosine-5-)-methyltransferase n=1 Tax=Streptomonospora salina TaxID=104205 RepID=A0A841E5Y9_9ACTN|nr:DNA cytosine methyltransferase [Streptomonospora salina]MBB5998426.1 DNA (cytosine-5)-methyltransferase 1 [Streptomonospora salina]
MTTTGTPVIGPQHPDRPTSAEPVAVGSLCTGIAGLDLGAAAALGGARLAWVADNDPDIARFLDARFPQVPNLGDLAEVAWRRVEPVDIIAAGFPCEDISISGRGAGIEEGTRSGTWTHVMDAVRLLRPRLLIVENVAALRWRWRGAGLSRLLCDLARLGYDARWHCLRARDVGAPHTRERLFLAAHPRGARRGPGPVPGGRAQTPRQAGGPARRDPARGRDQPRGHDLHPQLRSGCATADHSCSPGPERGGARARCSLSEPGGWGSQEEAIRRWEQVTGRPVPCPLEPGRRGGRRLSARFTEWLMGFEEGWVTDPALGLSREAHLRALGRAVVPQQARAVLDLLTRHGQVPS